jgi:hypothetical protein
LGEFGYWSGLNLSLEIEGFSEKTERRFGNFQVELQALLEFRGPLSFSELSPDRFDLPFEMRNVILKRSLHG